MKYACCPLCREKPQSERGMRIIRQMVPEKYFTIGCCGKRFDGEDRLVVARTWNKYVKDMRAQGLVYKPLFLSGLELIPK